MKIRLILRYSLLLVSFFAVKDISAQVKIGGTPLETPHASSILDLKSTNKGFLLPRMTNLEMLNIGTPADALIVFNTDVKTVFIYSLSTNKWRALAADSSEWTYDTVAKRVYLAKGYPVGDSIFYEPLTKKWVFSDRTQNTNSIGQNFPVTDFSGKYYFKSTASRFTDENNFNPTGVNVNFEIDSSGLHSGFRGMQIATVNNPKNNQPLLTVNSLSLSTIHAGGDSVTSITGITNSTTINGKGATRDVAGFTNSVTILDSAKKNIVNMTGIRNTMINVSPLTRINGSVFGYNSSINLRDTFGLPIVNGNVYGIFLGSVAGTISQKNYAIYTNKGLNRLADSTLITESGFANPRAILDVNSPTAMIIPTGVTSQRPLTPITGMMRYNLSTQSTEVYSGSSWNGILRAGFSIDLAPINPASGVTITPLFVTGAVVGNVVVVSPVDTVPNGLVIAWARVITNDQIEIRFENNNGTAIDPLLNTFNVRVMQ